MQVRFTWQLMDWPAPSGVEREVEPNPVPPVDPVSLVSPSLDVLIETAAPMVMPAGSGPAGGRKHAYLPGQDAKNRKLGLAGEKLVLQHEKTRLTAAGRADLAQEVTNVAIVEGDCAGYDIRSFKADGSDRHLEVKTTARPASNAFFISPNEIAFSDKNPDPYVLVRPYGALQTWPGSRASISVT